MKPRDDDELRAWVVGATLFGRASPVGDILARLERAGVRVVEGDAEAALVTSPDVVSTAPGLWRRR